jgi:hypothetical protein
MTSRLISAVLKRDRGNPSWIGNSHARALTATTVPGGKDRRPAPPGQFVKAPAALLEESLAPLADDLARSVESSRDIVVAETLSGVEHDLGPDDIAIR